MALRLLFLLLVWGLTLFVAAASLCNFPCSTDYEDSLNCSCPGSALLHPVLLNVTCREDDDEVKGSCVIKPPHSWCIIRPEGFQKLLSMGTDCNATASLQNSQVMNEDQESDIWSLSNYVKPRPLFNITVMTTGNFYNITWSKSPMYCLTYRVRIRTENSLQAPRLLLVDKEFYQVDHKQLEPHGKFIVDVQAKVCPDYLEGPWSEWSPSAEWRAPEEAADIEGVAKVWLYVSLPIVFIFGFLLLGYSQKSFLQKKLEMISYYPKPNDFFKPLYLKHGGNFEEWVKPVFKEYDYIRMGGSVPMLSEKQHSILHWNNEKKSYSKESEIQEEGHLFHLSQPTNNFLLNFQDSGSSQGTGHSTGHISIHTVTLSREDFEEEVTSQSSLRSYQDGESFGSFDDANRDHAGYDLGEPQVCRIGRQSGISLQDENQIANDLLMGNINFQPEGQIDEPERLSLHSFASNEQSEDGYPHVDLDTIDSGFGECSSPGASDSNRADHIDSFNEQKNSNSNYVKQWMICEIQEDTSNVRDEIH
ncbi:interleukin 21 receptor, tandem duplicate 1 [Melanotaenia boesemani]|uniref:interleukin 21 receptor, tandem duplicate 1 n=1 Tax=Melanotaenia boesemani TaxID=1250792 RepID=UPI001C040AB8|nr:interleukin 21 receptor, tandem duplicate 1 [Melanotaenia boesemani]XP_041842834.1 interleukin 21 receptor, tandem duplicate 1 [Melanotaenia boesemani]